MGRLGLQPIISILLMDSIPLVGGGQVRLSRFGHHTLVGPAGWLPPVGRGDLLGLRIEGGAIRIEEIDGAALPAPADDQQVRSTIARHYRCERWWGGPDALESRPAELTRAVAHAVLEDPALLEHPQRPLDESLYDALEQRADDHHWRDFAAARQGETVSFSISYMPEALHSELQGRAKQYGMSLDHYVIAILGFLAWRTPFSENLEPWESCYPDASRTRDNVHPIHTREALPDFDPDPEVPPVA